MQKGSDLRDEICKESTTTLGGSSSSHEKSEAEAKQIEDRNRSASTLTEEQRRVIEMNRQIAIHRRTLREDDLANNEGIGWNIGQGRNGGKLSNEQRASIEANRHDDKLVVLASGI